MELYNKDLEMDWRQYNRWTSHEMSCLSILKKYKIPSKDVGRILLRSPKAIEMKIYHLNKKRVLE